jgi:hypothetical protein
MYLEHAPSNRRSPRRGFAAAIAAIALLIAACGQAAAPSGAPAPPSVSSAPSPTQASVANSLATVTLPDSARVLATKTYGVVPVNQIVVILADGQGAPAAAALAASLQGRVVGQLDFLNAYQIETAGATEADLTAALTKARGTTGVTLAAPNQEMRPTAEPGEIWGTRISPLTGPPYNNENNSAGYGLIGVTTAWDYIRGSGMDTAPVQVGVVDSGLYNGTNEFGNVGRVSFTEAEASRDKPEQQTNADGTTSDDVSGGHGTGVNILIGADPNNGGPAGVASVLGENLTISNTNLWASDYGQQWTEAAPDPNDPTLVAYSNGKTYQYSGLHFSGALDQGARGRGSRDRDLVDDRVR